jgi:hypothetical protein
VSASDPDAGATVSLGVLNAPAGSTFPTTNGNPATGTFNWTPTAAGTVVLNLTAQDQHGVGAVVRSVQVVTRTPAAITWASPAPITYGTALGAAQLNATSTETGTFTYTPGSGTVLGAGDHVLSVTFLPANSSQYAPATATVSLQVLKAAQAIDFPPLAPRTYGDPPISVQATGGASGQPVTFTVGSSDPCTIAGQTVTLTGAGSCSVTAHQAGDQNYEPAPSVTRTISIAKVTPTIAWDTPEDIVYGTPLSSAQLNAVVQPDGAAANGTLSYSVGGAPAAGQVLHPGSHVLTVDYSPSAAGEANYLPATATVTITVLKAPQVIDFPALADRNVGDTFTVIATGGTSSQPVTFAAGPSGVCSVSGTTVTANGVGTCVVTADQAGDANYQPAAQVTRSFTVAYRVCSVDQPQAKNTGGVILLTFELCDAQGVNISTPNVTLQALTVDGSPAVAAGNSARDNLFRYTAGSDARPGRYQYSVDTRALSAGTHVLTYKVSTDPATHTFTFTTSLLIRRSEVSTPTDRRRIHLLRRSSVFGLDSVPTYGPYGPSQ